MLKTYKKQAVGAIGILLTLLITSIIFIMMIPTIRNVGAGMGAGGTSSLDSKSVEKRVNEQIEEIVKLREQTERINSGISQDGTNGR